ncbi:MAG: hypothetical protein IPL49_10805 [Saprospirales bacterium]|nr:hypothetical protein [Saprospirales bacterium]
MKKFTPSSHWASSPSSCLAPVPKRRQTEPLCSFLDQNVAGQELVTNDYRYTCQAGYTFSVIRLQYYTSNFVLHRDDGTEYLLDEVHYRELGLDDTRSITLPDVPPGKYTSLSFTYGLDEATNVDGGLPNTLTNINMEWPLPGDQGYHYMKFEGNTNYPDLKMSKPSTSIPALPAITELYPYYTPTSKHEYRRQHLEYHPDDGLE